MLSYYTLQAVGMAFQICSFIALLSIVILFYYLYVAITEYIMPRPLIQGPMPVVVPMPATEPPRYDTLEFINPLYVRHPVSEVGTEDCSSLHTSDFETSTELSDYIAISDISQASFSPGTDISDQATI